MTFLPFAFIVIIFFSLWCLLVSKCHHHTCHLYLLYAVYSTLAILKLYTIIFLCLIYSPLVPLLKRMFMPEIIPS